MPPWDPGSAGTRGGAALFDLKDGFYGGFTKWVYNKGLRILPLEANSVISPDACMASEKKLTQTRTRIELLDHNGCINSSSRFL